MQAFQFFGKHDLRLVEIPEPTLGENEVLLKIKKVGICGTDLHIYNGGMQVATPLTLGHEFVGDVVKIGKKVTDIAVGDKAVAEHVIGCGQCLYCKEGKKNLCKNPTIIGLHRQGALAEYLAVPAELVYPLPKTLDYDAGVLVEPLSIAVYALSKTQVQRGTTVAVLGQGPIGLFLDMVATSIGAHVYGFDKHTNRLDFAKRQNYVMRGIDITAPDFLKQFTQMDEKDGADIVFEAVGSEESAQLALDIAKPSGQVLILGVFEHNVNINMMQIVRKELLVQGAWTCIYTFAPALALLSTKKVDPRPLITHRYPFKDTAKAFAQAANDKANRIKTIIEY